MANFVMQTSKKFLSTKYNQTNASNLYSLLTGQNSICSLDTLYKEPAIDKIYKFIFIGTFPERRINGDKAKDAGINCLKAIKKDLLKLDTQTTIQFLLSMSNILIKDDELIHYFLDNLRPYQKTMNIKQLFAIFHTLYKLQYTDDIQWNQFLYEYFHNISKDMLIQDHIQYLYIVSNLFAMNQFDKQMLIESISHLKTKFIHQHIFLSKFGFQYIQFIYNIYPELINQNIHNLHINSDNQFIDLFTHLKRTYLIAKSIVNLKTHSQSIDYFENVNMPNVIRIKNEQINSQSTPYEDGVEEALKTLNLDYHKCHRLAIYDVDFFVNNIVLNVNGPVHFIETLDRQRQGYSPNFIMQQRHLQHLNLRKVVNLEYFDWGAIDFKQKKVEAMKKILEL